MIKKKIKDLLIKAKKTNELVIVEEIITHEIWNEIFELTNLQLLWLSNNQIKEIPKEIGKLTNLQNLYLSNNQIKILPKEIGELTNLQVLYLSNNQIKILPKEIGKLTNLQDLSFDNNQIKILPKEFEITNFKIFEKIKLSNLSNNINLIIGNNGTGKTILLQAITFSLIEQYNEDVTNMTLGKFIRKSTNSNKKIVSHFSPKDNKNNSKKAITKAIFNYNLSNEIFITNSLEHEKIFETGNLLLSYGVNLFHQKDVINRELLNNLISGEAENYSIETIFKDYSLDFIDPTLILHELNKHPDKEVKKVLEILLKTLNSFLSIEGEEQFQIVWDTKNNISYYYQNSITKENFILSELSEGYRANILLVSDIFIRILSARNSFSDTIEEFYNKATEQFNVCGTILIDEYDRHLHPNWQSLFLPKLTKILPNIQFFLTTHNPVSLQSAVGGMAHEIIFNNEKIEIQSSEIQAENILSIMSRFIDFDYDITTQNLLNKLSDTIKQINFGKIDLAYSKDFKDLVKKLLGKGEEINSVTSTFILRLNEILENNNQKPFSL